MSKCQVMNVKLGEQQQKRERILNAALDVFARYGYKRTSMNDIAQAAKMSRPALYLLFQNKEDIYRTLLDNLHQGIVAQVEMALTSAGSFKERLTNAFLAGHAKFYAFVVQSPHGEELLSQKYDIGADIVQKGIDDSIEVLCRAFEQANTKGEICLQRVGLTAVAYAELLIICVQRLIQNVSEADVWQMRLQQLVDVFVAAVTPDTA